MSVIGNNTFYNIYFTLVKSDKETCRRTDPQYLLGN
ncbi:uncharacterized protein An02g01280 [Aspergillus niger]|uniref:Contig An02c0010, genomic contig n=2 Tax=Aspergillus niger TaxID=5061 RepID=A2QBU8_ASPNC|nr:uncharacterized protein An02g01280 [Aspergillus niger]CAK96345.1 unnamed protein product [Aspergillus niger]